MAHPEVRRPVVLFTAEPFAYGPVSKLVAVARAIGQQCERRFIGTSTAFDFARRNHDVFDVVTDGGSLLDNATALDDVDLLVCVMDPAAALAAAQRDVPVVYLDSLHWLWEEGDASTMPALRNEAERLRTSKVGIADLDKFKKHEIVKMAYRWSSTVCLQGVEQRVARTEDQLQAPLRTVGAIIDRLDATAPIFTDTPFITMGGTLTPITPEAMAQQYLQLVDALLRPSLDVLGRPVVAGHPFAVETMSGLGWNAHELNRSQMQAQLESATFVIAPAGLTTAMEAAAAGTPLFVLPETSRSHGPNYALISGGDRASWPAALLPYEYDAASHPDHDVFASFHARLLDQANTADLAQLQKEARTHFEMLADPTTARAIAAAQRETMLNVVKGFDGAQEVADIVLDHVGSSPAHSL